MPTLHPQSIKDFPSLLEYLHDELDWDVDAEAYEDFGFTYTPEELGLAPQHAVAVEEAFQIRTFDETLPVFWFKFKHKRLPVVVLRRVLRAFVAKKRAGANKAGQKTYARPDDLFFICALGEEGKRGLTLAHFRPLEDDNLAQLRTFGWDGSETHFHYLEKHLHDLSWDKRADWGSAFIAEHGRAIHDAKALALELAEFARSIRDSTRSLYEVEADNGALHTLHKHFGALLGSTSEDEFADAVAQTVTSALLAVRFEGHTLENVALTELQHKIPFTNPFLTQFIEHLAGIGFNSAQGVDFDDLGIEELKAFLNAVNIEAIKEKFGSTAQEGAQDPIIHFYETFLAAYDSAERMKRGVFYTPKPVVDFIVRGVDHLLRTELGYPLGLADASQDEQGHYHVTILDPAGGTGTFFVSIIELVHETMCGEWKRAGKGAKEWPSLWNEYVSRDLLPRLFGFELMMAPYTVAHLKIGLKLSEFGYVPKSNERVNFFLTNTLEQSQQLALDLPGFLSHEASEAQRVKNQVRVTVVVGNPPYSGHSANENDWIRHLLRSKLPDGADSIFKVDGADLGERNPKWLNDDYVKFTRYAQFRLAESGRGVLGFITNHGYLDNPTFRGLRQSLLHTFPAMWQLDLHGNSKKKEKTPDGRADANVFEIQQGVSLNFGVKNANAGSVHHADLWGTQEDKYEWLRTHDFPRVVWGDVEPKSPNYLFYPQTSETKDEYNASASVTDVFGFTGQGFTTHRDSFAIAFDRHEAEERLRKMLSPQIADKELLTSFGLSETGSWQIVTARKTLRSEREPIRFIRHCLYRPFDFRWAILHQAVMDRPRLASQQHMMHHNLALATTRSIEIGRGFEHATVVNCSMDRHAVSLKEINYLFPLYLYNSPINWDMQLLGTGKDGRRANLAPPFVAQLGTTLNLRWKSDQRGDGKATFGPEDVLAYIYALFHAPSYRSRYAEFLKADFPRVPITDDATLFWQLVAQGRALIAAHLMESVAASADPVPSGEVAAGYPKFDKGRVFINATSGFDGVSEAVWNFHIGGYQVAHKWLKDRKGRLLTPDDARHYRGIITALEETIERMAGIDQIIESVGGWPLPGSQTLPTLTNEDVKRFFGTRGEAKSLPRPVKKQAKLPVSTAKKSLREKPASEKPASEKSLREEEESASEKSLSQNAPLKPTPARKGTLARKPEPENKPLPSIAELSRDEMIAALLAAMMPRTWHERDDVISVAAHRLGFGRLGKNIRAALKSALTGAIRRGLVEYETTLIKRVPKAKVAEAKTKVGNSKTPGATRSRRAS